MSPSEIRRLLAAGLRPEPSTRWCPAADVYRTHGGWLVKVELAGVARNDVGVATQGNTLIVRGKRRDTQLTEGGEQFRLEISYSEFERRIPLPCDLTRAHLEIELCEGMLLVRVESGASA